MCKKSFARSLSSLEDQKIVYPASLSLSYHLSLAMEVRNYCLPVESDLVATVVVETDGGVAIIRV